MASIRTNNNNNNKSNLNLYQRPATGFNGTTPHTHPITNINKTGFENSKAHLQRTTDTANSTAPTWVHRHPHDGKATAQARQRPRHQNDTDESIIFLRPTHCNHLNQALPPTPTNHGHRYAFIPTQRETGQQGTCCHCFLPREMTPGTKIRPSCQIPPKRERQPSHHRIEPAWRTIR